LGEGYEFIFVNSYKLRPFHGRIVKLMRQRLRVKHQRWHTHFHALGHSRATPVGDDGFTLAEHMQKAATRLRREVGDAAQSPSAKRPAGQQVGRMGAI
jgi:hypothetical protein